ncbi:2,5-dichloro-2,5-cyclohexadiene-1,4-diol dehydrogenase LinX [subsurface metagenome]
MGRIDDKVAVITGAGSGMGRAAAILFAKEGAKVVVGDWVTEGGEETVRMIKEAGGEAIFIKVDVSRTEDVKKMIKAAIDTYGKLDILYNNAGIDKYDNLGIDRRAPTEENFDKTIGVNLKGIFFGMEYAIPEMIKTGGGSIINTASVAALEAMGIPIYAASKGGVISLSRTMAVEFISRNIRINCIVPGAIATGMNLSWSSEELKRFSEAIPQGRFGKPEEVAQLALFLVSDEASYITAQTVVIDGGWSARAP